VMLVVGLCVIAVAGSTASGTAGTAQARPLLGIPDTSPFEIRGTGFVPREQVQVLLAVNGRAYSGTAVASSTGTFRLAFPARLGACGRFTVSAFGSKGSRARVLPRRPLPDCVSPTSTGSRT